MRSERPRRALVIAGAVALAVQALVAARFAAVLRAYWREIAPRLSFATVSERMSQLKPALFKAPWSWLYLALFLAGALGVLGALVAAGVRAAWRGDDDA